jgi:hypothetical protein
LSVKSVTPYSDFPIADDNTPWDGAEAMMRIRKFTGSTDAPTPDYRKCFFWYDGENTELFGSYKLQFVDVINGKLYAIPKAIYAVAGVLNGARGGVDIPDADRAGEIANVNKYYKKMGKESPVTKTFITKDAFAECKTLRDVETALKDSGFSIEAAKTFISAVKNIVSLEHKFVDDLKTFANQVIKK